MIDQVYFTNLTYLVDNITINTTARYNISLVFLPILSCTAGRWFGVGATVQGGSGDCAVAAAVLSILLKPD